MQSFYVALIRPVDKPLDDDIEHVFRSFGYNRAGLKISVESVVLVPGSDLLLGDIGQPQNFSRTRYKIQDGLRGLAVGHVHNVIGVEQMRRAERQIARDKSIGLPAIRAFPDVSAAGCTINKIAIDDDRLDIARADVTLRLHRNRRRSDGVRIYRRNAPLSRGGHDEELGQGNDMADCIGLSGGHLERDPVIIANGQRIAHVALRARFGHPDVLRFVDGPREAAALLEVGYRGRIRAGSVEHCLIGRRAHRQIGGDVIVYDTRAGRLPDVAVHPTLHLIHVIERGPGDGGPGDGNKMARRI